MTYVLPSMTQSTTEPLLFSVAPWRPPDAGLFYVRWWGHGSTHPVEYQFDSRAKALDKITDLYRDAPYVRIEMLEATEWGTRSRSERK